MLRTIQTVERNLKTIHIPPMTLVTNTDTTVVPDISKWYSITEGINPSDEIAVFQLMNCGGNKAYYNFSGTCDNQTNYCGYLDIGQQLSVPARVQVNMFCPGGTIIAFTMFKRVNE